MKTKIAAIIATLLVLSALFTIALAASDKEQNVNNLDKILENVMDSSDFDRVELTETIINYEFKLYDDNPLPVTVNIKIKPDSYSGKTMYLFHGTGSNFPSSFDTPSNSLAKKLVDEGYLVIGITHREDSAPPGFEFGDGYGSDQHTMDGLRVMAMFQRFLKTDYETLGISSGGIDALRIASIIGDSDQNLKA